MRRTILALAGALTLAAACGPAAGQTSMADGEVRKIDKAQGKLTLKHGPIRNLDMDSMTMVFRVQDQTMLDQLKVGDKVKFEAARVNGQLTVTRIQK